jgi:hypothetical protein
MKQVKFDFILLSRSSFGLMFEHWRKDVLSDNFPNSFEESERFATVPDVPSSSRKEEHSEPEIDASKLSWPHSSKEEAKYIFDPSRFDTSKKWCIYNVMLVEWIEGVAYRLELGRIHIDAFFEAKPWWKHVVLG